MASGNSSFNDLVYAVAKLGMSAQEYSSAIETLQNNMIKTIST